jgi:hypothetical protein
MQNSTLRNLIPHKPCPEKKKILMYKFPKSHTPPGLLLYHEAEKRIHLNPLPTALL